jgi:hypothetical protein
MCGGNTHSISGSRAQTRRRNRGGCRPPCSALVVSTFYFDIAGPVCRASRGMARSLTDQASRPRQALAPDAQPMIISKSAIATQIPIPVRANLTSRMPMSSENWRSRSWTTWRSMIDSFRYAASEPRERRVQA